MRERDELWRFQSFLSYDDYYMSGAFDDDGATEDDDEDRESRLEGLRRDDGAHFRPVIGILLPLSGFGPDFLHSDIYSNLRRLVYETKAEAVSRGGADEGATEDDDGERDPRLEGLKDYKDIMWTSIP